MVVPVNSSYTTSSAFVESIVEECVVALAFGPAGLLNAGIYKALLHLSAVLNWVAGRSQQARLLLTEANLIDSLDDMLPGSAREVGAAIQLLLEGKAQEAMANMRELSLLLSERGFRYAARISLWLALVVWPDQPTADAYVAMRHEEHDEVAEPLLTLLRDVTKPSVKAHQITESMLGSPDVQTAGLVIAAMLRRSDAADGFADGLSDALAIMGADVDSLAMSGASSPMESGGSPLLTRREREIALLAKNHSNAAIAGKLNLSVRTVENHLYNAMKRVGVASREDLFRVVTAAF